MKLINWFRRQFLTFTASQRKKQRQIDMDVLFPRIVDHAPTLMMLCESITWHMCVDPAWADVSDADKSEITQIWLAKFSDRLAQDGIMGGM